MSTSVGSTSIRSTTPPPPTAPGKEREDVLGAAAPGAVNSLKDHSEQVDTNNNNIDQDNVDKDNVDYEPSVKRQKTSHHVTPMAIKPQRSFSPEVDLNDQDIMLGMDDEFDNGPPPRGVLYLPNHQQVPVPYSEYYGDENESPVTKHVPPTQYSSHSHSHSHSHCNNHSHGSSNLPPPAGDESWNARLSELVAFQTEYGNCLVPKKSRTHPQLGIWVMNQRAQYKLLQEGKPSTMTPERIQALESIGFVWSMCDHVDWEARLEELREYKAEHGDCLVPNKYSPNPQLGTWVNKQRTQYKLMADGKPSSMTRERVDALKALGFVWSKRDLVDWHHRLDELKQYKAEHGDCLVPNKYPRNPQLGTWVMHQRAQYRKLCEGKNSPMTKERVRHLEQVGFVWAISNADTDWNKRVEELRQYVRQHGNCLVPNKYADNPKLGAWVGKQRKQYKMLQEGKHSNMTPDRIAILEELGFVWSLRSLVDWDARLEELKSYRMQHGNCLVPQQYPENPQLGTWVSNQRKQYRLMKEGKPSPMTAERVSKLDDLGFVWSIFTHDTHWEAKYDELKEFKGRRGHCDVPETFPENPNLGIWVKYQRAQYAMLQERRPTTMTPERIELLEYLGFQWHYQGPSPTPTSSSSSLRSPALLALPKQEAARASSFKSSKSANRKPLPATSSKISSVIIDHASRRDLKRPSMSQQKEQAASSPWQKHWKQQQRRTQHRRPELPAVLEDDLFDLEPLEIKQDDIVAPRRCHSPVVDDVDPDPEDWDKLFNPIDEDEDEVGFASHSFSRPLSQQQQQQHHHHHHHVAQPSQQMQMEQHPEDTSGQYMVYYDVPGTHPSSAAATAAAAAAAESHAVVSPQYREHYPEYVPRPDAAGRSIYWTSSRDGLPLPLPPPPPPPPQQQAPPMMRRSPGPPPRRSHGPIVTRHVLQYDQHQHAPYVRRITHPGQHHHHHHPAYPMVNHMRSRASAAAFQPPGSAIAGVGAAAGGSGGGGGGAGSNYSSPSRHHYPSVAVARPGQYPHHEQEQHAYPQLKRTGSGYVSDDASIEGVHYRTTVQGTLANAGYPPQPLHPQQLAAMYPADRKAAIAAVAAASAAAAAAGLATTDPAANASSSKSSSSPSPRKAKSPW